MDLKRRQLFFLPMTYVPWIGSGDLSLNLALCNLIFTGHAPTIGRSCGGLTHSFNFDDATSNAALPNPYKDWFFGNAKAVDPGSPSIAPSAPNYLANDTAGFLVVFAMPGYLTANWPPLCRMSEVTFTVVDTGVGTSHVYIEAWEVSSNANIYYLSLEPGVHTLYFNNYGNKAIVRLQIGPASGVSDTYWGIDDLSVVTADIGSGSGGTATLYWDDVPTGPLDGVYRGFDVSGILVLDASGSPSTFSGNPSGSNVICANGSPTVFEISFHSVSDYATQLSFYLHCSSPIVVKAYDASGTSLLQTDTVGTGGSPSWELMTINYAPALHVNVLRFYNVDGVTSAIDDVTIVNI